MGAVHQQVLVRERNSKLTGVDGAGNRLRHSGHFVGHCGNLLSGSCERREMVASVRRERERCQTAAPAPPARLLRSVTFLG